MKQRLRYSLSILGVCLSLHYTPVAIAQVNPSPENNPPSRRVLQLGNEGSAVSQVQAVLKLLGYYNGEITGTYDELTQNAVSRFQEAAELPPDGVFGQQSWNRLLPFEPGVIASEPTPEVPPTSIPTTAVSTPAVPEASPTPTTTVSTSPVPEETVTAEFPILRLGMTGEAVRELQSRLQDLGYFEGIVDGVFGERTLAAVEAAQTELNLAVDGIVGQATWEALRR